MTDVPSPESLMPGSLVGPWRIEGYAGRGAYGLVFRARLASQPLSPLVALKLAASDAAAYVGRAEVKLSLGQKSQAAEDLRRAAQLSKSDDPVAVKATAMLEALGRR